MNVTKKTNLGSKSAGQPKKHMKAWRVLINALVALALAYIVYSQRSMFGGSVERIQNAEPGWLIMGVVFIFATYVLAALQYKALAQKPIKFVPTWVVQLAGALVNRILPAGLGGLGLNADYLHRNKHSITQAGVVAGTNNLMGIAVHIALVLLIIAIGGSVSNFTAPSLPPALYIASGLFVLAITLIFMFVPKARHLLRVAADDIKKSVVYYKKHPWRLGAAAVISLLVSLCFIASVYAATRALGIDSISFSQAAIIMTMGVLIGTATPTPGGVVGAEAGLAAALVAYGLPTSEAIAVAILYRVFSYWLPLIVGGIAFIIAQKKRYI